MPGFSLASRLDGAIGGKTATAFEKAFGVKTVGELLEHYPRRYARRGELTPIDSLPLGEPVTIVAEVVSANERRMQNRRGSLLEVVISDGDGRMSLTFFNQPWRLKDLTPGRRGIFSGKVGEYRRQTQLTNPDYELFDDIAEARAEAEVTAKRPIPIYPATSSIPSTLVQKTISLVLDGLGEVEDPLPDDLRARRGLLPARAAFEQIHRPETDDDIPPAIATLRMHEAFVLQTALLQQRQFVRALSATKRPAAPGGLLERFDAILPFELTADQLSVGAQLEADLVADWPMNRLVQGEVGSGKTLVALRAMLQVAESGGQSALIAPTEVLAGQHLRSIARMLGPELAPEIMPTLLTGQMPAAERRRAALRVASGQARIVVGTHALLSATTTFADLGFVVVDEQHRFGVDQREALRAKGSSPHTLVLTATPIPRTVAMTVFGDLDVSTIHELPAGRAGIESFVVPTADRPGWMGRVWQRVSEEVATGRQALVVCSAIDRAVAEEGEELAATANDASAAEADAADPNPAPAPALPHTVVDTLAELQRLDALSGLRIQALHGRMSSEEKDAIMQSFAAGDIDILVATTVIEVGVDVPNASTMVVLDSDRFGGSQLHQRRGRVGRGQHAGLCLLVTGAPVETTARERVGAVASTIDGFELATIDLELRREGDVLGNRQSGGRSSLKLLRVVSDGDLIMRAREHAGELLAGDPDLGQHPALRSALERRLDDAERAALSKN